MVSEKQTNFFTELIMKGLHYVTVRSPYGDQQVEFCAY